jgi:hypothetical protein
MTRRYTDGAGQRRIRRAALRAAAGAAVTAEQDGDRGAEGAGEASATPTADAGGAPDTAGR